MDKPSASPGGRVAIVTGGAKGIGRATVEALIAEGARPVLFDRDEPALASASRQLAERGIDHFTEHLDVSDEAAVEDMGSAALEQFRQALALLNTARAMYPK